VRVAKAVVLFIVLVLLIASYLYVIFWSEEWKWKFWVSGDLEDLFYLVGFTFVWGLLIRAVWKAIVSL